METIYFIAVRCNALKTIILITKFHPVSEIDIINSAKHAKKCVNTLKLANNSFVLVILIKTIILVNFTDSMLSCLVEWRRSISTISLYRYLCYVYYITTVVNALIEHS